MRRPAFGGLLRSLLAGLVAGVLVVPMMARADGKSYDLGTLLDAIKGVSTAVEAASDVNRPLPEDLTR